MFVENQSQERRHPAHLAALPLFSQYLIAGGHRNVTSLSESFVFTSSGCLPFPPWHITHQTWLLWQWYRGRSPPSPNICQSEKPAPALILAETSLINRAHWTYSAAPPHCGVLPISHLNGLLNTCWGERGKRLSQPWFYQYISESAAFEKGNFLTPDG